MKILILASELDVGGAETHIETLCRSLVRAGVEVVVASGGGRVAKRLEETGIKHLLIKKPTRSPVLILLAQRDIYKIIKEEKPTLVHAHTRLSALAADGICRLTNTPMVTTAHALFSMTPVKARLSCWGEMTAAVSEDVRRHLVSRGGVLPERIRVIENGVPVPSGENKRRNGHKVLFVSRMDSDCSLGAYLLCDIAPMLAEKYPDLCITLVGGGEELEGVRRAARRANGKIGRKVVQMTGGVDDPSAFFDDTDVFVGVSRAALEAMAHGVPAILLGNEGFLGLFEENNAPVARSTNFCARGEKKASAPTLLSVLDRFFSLPNKRRAELSTFCRETVKKDYSAELMGRKTLEFYCEAIEKYRAKECKAKKRNKEKTTCKKTRKRILLCGYYGFGNLGDDAILCSVLKELAPLKDTVEICVLGSKKRTKLLKSINSTVSRVEKNSAKCNKIKTKTTQIKQESSFPCRLSPLLSPLAALREMKHTDVFIFGGGSLLQNKTSDRSLLYYLFLIDRARKHCKRTVMLSNGIGPIADVRYRRAALAAVSSFDKISVRDSRSQRVLSRALPKRKINLFPDPALLLVKNTVNGNGYSESTAESFIDKEKIHVKNPKTCTENSKRRVKRTLAICLCGGELARYGVTADKVAESLRYALDALCAAPLFIVMNERADLSVTKQVASLLDKHVLKSASRAAEFDTRVFCPHDADELLSLLARADLSLCMRYHAALFSVGAGMTTLAVGSDQKLSSFCADAGAYSVAPTAILCDREGLTAHLFRALEHFSKNGAEIGQNIEKMRSLCSKSFKELINYINTLDFEI